MNLLRSIFLICSLIASANVLAEKLNINTADADHIAAEMTGVGENKAKAIVEYRKQHGNFKSIDELARVKGIGEKTVEKNRDNLAL